MPDNIIQSADQYATDKYYDGVVDPNRASKINSDPAKYNHVLTDMYTSKYNRSYQNFDQFKAAYQEQYGDPFKKKEETKPTQQETPSGNFVAPLKETQVSTFQPSDERKLVTITESQDSLRPPTEQQKQQELYSSGLLENTGSLPQDNKVSKTSEIASESTAASQKTLSFEDAKNISAESNPEFAQYLAPLNRAVYDALPQAVRTLNNIGGYIGEQAGAGPASYTFEEHEKAYETASPSQKAAMWVSLIRPAQLWHDKNEEYMTASPEVEESFAGQVSGGLGQAITMLAGSGVASKSLALGGELLTAAKYANTLSKSTSAIGAAAQAAKGIATQPATYLAASQVFNQEFDQAYSQTGDSDTAFKSALINTIGSAGLEAMPIMSFMGRLDKTTGGGVKQVLANGLKGGFEEATTEVLQQALSNTVAADLYDETRTLTDGMIQSGEVGGLTGFALNVIGAALGAKLRTTQDPYEAQEIKKSQEYIQEKKAAFDKEQEQIISHMENQVVSMKTTEMENELDQSNITNDNIVKASDIQSTMPNHETIGPKTIGLTNKRNELIVEKDNLYASVTNIPEKEAADARSKEIDSEIRSITSTIGEFYAQPSKKEIESISADAPIDKATQTSDIEGSESRAKQKEESAQIIGEENTTQEELPPTEEEDLSDPEVVATKYHEERTNPVHTSPAERAIADLLSSGVSKEGVQRQGDVNKFSNSMARAYFKEGGQTIDQIAQQASSTINPDGDGNEVTPEDVWDFMNKFPQGPDQIDRPAGNPRLKELSEKYQDLTGKQLNKAIAKKISEASKKPVENKEEDPNSIIDKYVNEDESINLDALEQDIPALGFLYDLNEEQINQVKEYVKETREADRVRSESVDSGKTKPETTAKSEKVTFADKSDTIREIKEKKLTHVKGVSMGSGIAKGTYLSTENGNRYKDRGKLFNAEVEVENPYTPSENDINSERAEILSNNLNSFTETDFEGAEIPANPTIDDLSDSGTEKLADLFTKNLQEQGYDSMYLPESSTQEGELVVFDQSKVKLQEDKTNSDAARMAEEEWTKKYPEGDYQDARAEYLKNTENVVELNKEGKTMIGVLGLNNNIKMPFDMDLSVIGGKIKDAWIKNMRVGGYLPFDMVFRNFTKTNTIKQRATAVEESVHAIEKTIKKELGVRKLTDAMKLQLNEVLKGGTPKTMFSSEVLGQVNNLRNLIKALQTEMKQLGLLSDPLTGEIGSDDDFYLNRTYKKWLDPTGWRDKVPQTSINKVINLLKNEQHEYWSSKHKKAQDKQMNRAGKLAAFRTNINNKKAALAENQSRLDAYKVKHEVRDKKYDIQIKKLKKKANKEQVGPDLEGNTKKTKLEKRIELLEAERSESQKEFNKIYEAKKAKFDRQSDQIESAILKAEQAAYNIQQSNHSEQMNEAMDKMLTPDMDEINAYIEQILYAPTKDFTPTGKAGSISKSIFTKRSEYLNETPEVRELMGEVTDPFINTLNSTHKIIAAIETYKFQKDFREMGMGTVFSPKPSNKHHRQIEGDAWRGLTEDGPIYTTELMEESMKNLNADQQSDDGQFAKMFRTAVSAIKVGKTVTSTPAAVANFISNTWHIASNSWNPIDAPRYLMGLNPQELSKEMIDLKNRGVLGQSVSGRELSDRVKEINGLNTLEEAASQNSISESIYKAAKWYGKANADLFAWGDNYAKIVGFYSELDSYRKVYPSWTEEQLRTKAAQNVSKLSPTFDYAAPIVQKLRKSMFFSTFATFPAEQWRNLTNQAYQIKEELAHPETKMIAYKRMGAFLGSAAMAALLMNYGTKLIGGDHEDDEDLRLFVSDYSKTNPLIWIEKEGSKATYIDAARFTYHSYFMAPFIAFANGDMEQEEFENKMWEATAEMSAPFTDTNILTETIFDVMYGRKLDDGRQIFSANDTKYDMISKLYKHAGNKLEPTNVKITRSWYDLAKYGKDEYGREITPTTAALSTFGIKTRTVEIDKQFRRNFYQLKEQGDIDKNVFEQKYMAARDESEQNKAVDMYTSQLTLQIKKMAYLKDAAVRQGAGESADVADPVMKMPYFIKLGVMSGSKNEEDITRAAKEQIDKYIQELTGKKK